MRCTKLKQSRFGPFFGCRNWKRDNECAKSAGVKFSALATEFPLYRGSDSKPVTHVKPAAAKLPTASTPALVPPAPAPANAKGMSPLLFVV